MSLRDNGGLDESTDDRELVRDGIFGGCTDRRRPAASRIQSLSNRRGQSAWPIGWDATPSNVLCAIRDGETLSARKSSQAKSRCDARVYPRSESLGEGEIEGRN